MIECSMTGLILLYRVVPESPRWLISNGRIKEAKAIITEVGRENQRQVPLHLFSNNNTSQAEESREEEKSRSVLSIFKSRRMGLRTLNMCYQWFSVTMCYYGLSFASTSLSDDPYTIFVLK